MSIEIRSPAAPSNPTGKVPADTSRARSPGTPLDGQAAAVSFLSLLGAMGEGLPNMLAPAAIKLAGASTPTDAATMAGDASLGDDLRTGATQPAGVALPTDALLAAILLSADLTSVQLPVPPDNAPAALAGAGRQAAGGRWDGTQAGGGTANGQPKLEEAAPLAVPSDGGKKTQALQQLAVDRPLEQLGKPAPAASSRDFMARVDAARTAAEHLTTGPAAGVQTGGGSDSAMPQLASMFDASTAGLRAGGGPLRQQDRVQTRAGAAGVHPGFVAWGDATPAGTSHGANAVYAPGAMTPTPATAIAEKMHYWVSRGVQSAALQLDAFAGGTVDVNIAVKGDAAVVEFRTDQPQARQMLLDAMPQLKELLAAEGLMLSGGLVGDSSQQDAQSRYPDGQAPGGRSATVVSTPEPVAGRLTPARATREGGVDLFV